MYCSLKISQRRFCLQTLCPAGHLDSSWPSWHFVSLRLVSLDVLSLWTLCPSGHFVPLDIMSHGHSVSGRLVSEFFVSCHCPLRLFVSKRLVWVPYISIAEQHPWSIEIRWLVEPQWRSLVIFSGERKTFGQKRCDRILLPKTCHSILGRRGGRS